MIKANFTAKAPWWGGDLQTLANRLTKNAADLSRYPAERLFFSLPDGDRLQAVLHRQQGSDHPLCVIIHGLTGCEGSYNVLNSAKVLLDQGYPVLRINLRGAGPSAETCTGFYHAGKYEDLQEMLTQLDPSLMEGGLVLIGFSLGGNMLARFLAETGEAFPIRFATTISAPLDLKKTQECLAKRRNRLYERFLLNGMKEWVGQADALTPSLKQNAERAQSVFEFDDTVVAKHYGYASAASYYQTNSAKRFLHQIRCPLFMLHANDDPWIPVEAYETFNWSAATAVTPILTNTGGHCGFHDQHRTIAWYDNFILQHLAEVG